MRTSACSHARGVKLMCSNVYASTMLVLHAVMGNVLIKPLQLTLLGVAPVTWEFGADVGDVSFNPGASLSCAS